MSDRRLVVEPLLERAAVGTEKSKRPLRTLPPVVIIPIWITLSAGVILYNKFIFTTLKFSYPITLTAYHMLVATIATQCIKFFKKDKFHVTWTTYTRRIIPLAVLFAASLMLSNIAYLHLSVSFVQMLKAFIPILTLIIRLIAGLEQYSRFLLVLIFLTSVGCSVAASGEINVSAFGFICQIVAIVMESCRLVTIELVLKDVKPLQSVTLYAPLCAGLIAACIPVMEGMAPYRDFNKIGPLHLLLNGAVAFGLNIAGVYLIEAAGSVVLTLSGVVKDVLLLCAATILFGSVISLSQGLGYALALGSIMVYRLTGGSAVQGRILVQTVERRSIIRFVVAAVAALAVLGFSQIPSSTHAAQMISYPILTNVTLNGEGKFSRYTQSGPGLDIIPPFDDSVDVTALPLVAWVVVATPDAIAKYGDMLTMMACYCAQRNIPFFLEHQLYVDDRHFFTARHRSIAKYLRYHQWVFATDADTLLGDSEVDLRQWLDDSVDVIFNDRFNHEVCACVFFVHNSPGGWSFIRRWFAWADKRHNINYDNGDLNEMIGAGLYPGAPNNADYSGRITASEEKDHTTGCILPNGSGWGMYASFVACFHELLGPWRYGDDSQRYWQKTLWDWTNNELPPTVFRSFKTMAGFNRIADHDGKVPSYGHKKLPRDFLISGKNLDKLAPMDAILCTGKPWALQPQWTEEQTRKVIGTELGMKWYPGCWIDGLNVC